MKLNYSLKRNILLDWPYDDEPDYTNYIIKPNDIKNSIIGVDVDYSSSLYDLEIITKGTGLKQVNFKKWTLVDSLVISFKDKRFVLNKNDKQGTLIFKIENENIIIEPKEEKEGIEETDMSDTEQFLIEAYKNLSIYIEDNLPIEPMEEMPLGAYYHVGNDSNKKYPCVILYRNNIIEEAKELNKTINNKSLSTIEYLLTMFVLVHELAHAFFNKGKDKGNGYSEEKIEECLANYAALLHAKKKGGLFLKIGRLLVERQVELKNEGYHYALTLFDNHKLTGWWKWRYCCKVQEDKSYQNLDKVSDLTDILDF